MRFINVLNSYISDVFKGTEAERAVGEYIKHIPGRVLQMEFDAAHSNKQGVKDGNKVYKLGLDLSKSTVYMEYFDDANQAQPTMAIFVDKARPAIIVNGWQVDKKMLLSFTVVNGQVHKAVQVS